MLTTFIPQNYFSKSLEIRHRSNFKFNRSVFFISFQIQSVVVAMVQFKIKLTIGGSPLLSSAEFIIIKAIFFFKTDKTIRTMPSRRGSFFIAFAMAHRYREREVNEAF